MASRVVYTAITNGHAELSPHPDIPDTDFICYSDVPLDRDDWQVRPLEAPAGLSPRMQAKFHKVFPPSGYAWSVWIDGAYELHAGAQAKFFVDGLIQHSPKGLGLHTHPVRDCLYDEAAHAMTLPKCSGIVAVLEEQAAHYARQGHPKHSGLWAAGLLCRKDDTAIRKLMQLWWDELVRWTWRDQISLAYVLARERFAPTGWSWSMYPTPYMKGWRFNAETPS